MRSVAMPPLGTGAGHLGIEESAELMIPVLIEHMESNAFTEAVVVVVESEYEEDVFGRRLQQAYEAREPGTLGAGSH